MGGGSGFPDRPAAPSDSRGDALGASEGATARATLGSARDAVVSGRLKLKSTRKEFDKKGMPYYVFDFEEVQAHVHMTMDWKDPTRANLKLKRVPGNAVIDMLGESDAAMILHFYLESTVSDGATSPSGGFKVWRVALVVVCLAAAAATWLALR